MKDAEAFAASMKKAAAGLYGEVRITLALDKQATRDNLEKLIGKIAEVHPRDTFILFAAAHGTSENGRFYFIPQDYEGGPGHLAQRAIGQDRLQDWLANRIKAKRAIILLDTCESGALVAGHARSRADAPASEAAVGRLHEATGRPVLTAAAAGQFAHEGLSVRPATARGLYLGALDALRNGDATATARSSCPSLCRMCRAWCRKSPPTWGVLAAPQPPSRSSARIRALWVSRRGFRRGPPAALASASRLDSRHMREYTYMLWCMSTSS